MPDRNKQNEPGFSDIPLPPLELPSGAAIESVLTESDTSWRLRFAKLADNWRTATRRLSSVSQISMHPSYPRFGGKTRALALGLTLHHWRRSGPGKRYVFRGRCSVVELGPPNGIFDRRCQLKTLNLLSLTNRSNPPAKCTITSQFPPRRVCR